MDTIIIRDLKVFAHHGVTPEERAAGQDFLIDVDIEVDAKEAAERDDLSLTVDYAKAVESAERIATGESFDLIETLASRIADHFLSLDGVARVAVTVKKPHAPLPAPVGWVGVSVSRGRGEGGGT